MAEDDQRELELNDQRELADVRSESLARIVGKLTPLVFCDETDQLRHVIEENFEPTRERSLMLTKLDELELWATRAQVRGGVSE